MRSVNIKKIDGAVREILMSVPDTRELLAMAENVEGISIFYDDDMLTGTVRGIFSLRNGTIQLKPGRSDIDTALTLAHELRHMWQFKLLGVTSDNEPALLQDNPRDAVIIERFLEADACAFAALAARRFSTYYRALDPECGDAEFLKRRFQEMLEQMETYDQKMVIFYHRAYTHPAFKPQERRLPPGKKPVDAATIRKICRAGIHADSQSYIDDMPDVDLALMVWGPVANDVRRAARLMNSFEKASKKMPQEAAQKTRLKINAHISGIKTALDARRKAAMGGR